MFMFMMRWTTNIINKKFKTKLVFIKSRTKYIMYWKKILVLFFLFGLLSSSNPQKIFIDVSKRFGVTAKGINKAIDLARYTQI